MKIRDYYYYDAKWRKLEVNELPKIGDVWFPGGCCPEAAGWEPRILDETDSLDPVGFTDSAIFRNPKDKTKVFWDKKYKS